MKTNISFLIISHSVLLRMRNVSDNSCRENQNTHFMFCNFSRKSCRLRGNVEKYGTAGQVTHDHAILYMTFACWIPKATQTLRICNTYCFSTSTMVTRTRLCVMLYVHRLSCCFLFLLTKSPILLLPTNYSKILNMLFHYTGVHF